MQVELELFGALRGLEPGDRLDVSLAGNAIADLRRALQDHAASAWPASARSLLSSCAFATASEILRDPQPLPEDGRLAVLPPVSGG